ncbi:hypothetical protein [Amycolatopsis orientalis]|uniref:hypothetical protein n=1 Tax=Amycolatopsis orientalis TaxID=31958 RepID=UPI00039C3569|nr:hypothetical protein [Amycolatopsis orientalis]
MPARQIATPARPIHPTSDVVSATGPCLAIPVCPDAQKATEDYLNAVDPGGGSLAG